MDRRDISRRRPMLQLNQSMSSIRAKNKATDEAKKRQESKNVLQGLLGDYSESDDEKDEEEAQIENPSKGQSQPDSFSSSNNQSDIQKPSSDTHLSTTSQFNSEHSIEMDQSEESIEAALKNFLSEINALPITSIDKNSTLEKTSEKSKNIVPTENDQIASQLTHPEGDWQRHFHQEEKRYYYFNSRTGETCWDLDTQTNVLGTSLMSRSDEEPNNLDSSKEDSNREVDIHLNQMNTIDDTDSVTSLRPPSLDSPLHIRSRDAYDRLSIITPMATHLRLERHQIEFATRLHDWQVGALNSYYFEKVILEGLEMLIRSIEEQISPTGWVCKWKSDSKTYTWLHIQSNQVSLTYPSPDLIASLNTHSLVVNNQECSTAGRYFNHKLHHRLHLYHLHLHYRKLKVGMKSSIQNQNPQMMGPVLPLILKHQVYQMCLTRMKERERKIKIL
ncbi:formin-binding protein 4-like [Gigaspora margarita]|uniref:Formin-binding protein 4-like n=1 Tax=Gigaspora margarita TaxID=4874 RepID=A0A8H4AWT1_GIGMA|nr:formin-binding protein 4-like [Gigaspora margarita]